MACQLAEQRSSNEINNEKLCYELCSAEDLLLSIANLIAKNSNPFACIIIIGGNYIWYPTLSDC